jgi:UDP-glucuronate 4-epimerase
MRILLTGAAGFVGLALTEGLLSAGHEVMAFDRNPLPGTARSAFTALPGRLTEAQGDVRRPEDIAAALRAHRPEALVIGAAITAGSARERSEPLPVVEVNIGGAAATLQAVAAQNSPPARLLLLSSNAVYGAGLPGELHFDEAVSVPRPANLYGVTKWTAELVALQLASSMGLDLHVARLGTCFGPWERDTGVRDTLSPPFQILQRAVAGEEVVLPRPGRRDWLYSRDMALGLRSLLEAPSLASACYNLGGGRVWPLTDWCQVLADCFPGLRWRIAALGEDATIDLYATQDRPPMRVARLAKETGFAADRTAAAMAADFLAWHGMHGMALAAESAR